MTRPHLHVVTGTGSHPGRAPTSPARSRFFLPENARIAVLAKASKERAKRLYGRVIRDQHDRDKLATSLGFSLGAVIAVLIAWAVRS